MDVVLILMLAGHDLAVADASAVGSAPFDGSCSPRFGSFGARLADVLGPCP